MSSSAPSPLLEVYFEKRPLLLRYFTARARNAETAEDIVQDIYVRIAGLAPDANVGNPSAYLFTVGTNIWRNHIRTHSRATQRDYQWQSSTTETVGQDAIVPEPSAERVVELRQDLARVTVALNELPAKTRDIFMLYRLEGLTQAAVARQLDISKSSVEKHLVVAMRHLTARLAPSQGP